MRQILHSFNFSLPLKANAYRVDYLLLLYTFLFSIGIANADTSLLRNNHSDSVNDCLLFDKLSCNTGDDVVSGFFFDLSTKAEKKYSDSTRIENDDLIVSNSLNHIRTMEMVEEAAELTCEPTANNDSYSGCPGTNFNENVSANDQNLDNPTFRISSQPSNGFVSINNSGIITFVPNGGFCGTDEFRYEVCNEVPVVSGPSVPAEIFNDCGSNRKIDVYTYGLLDGNTALPVPDPTNFERILVEIWFDVVACPDIDDINSIQIEGNTVSGINITNTSGVPQREKVFRVFLNSINGNSVNISYPAGCVPESGALYVERIQSGFTSSLVLSNREFFHNNGNADCFTEDLPIPISTTNRDVIVTVPIHEKDNAPRPVTLRVTAGGIVINETLSTANAGNGAGEFNVTVPNVPGGVDVVSVRVCSPTPDGDSFGVGAISLTNTSCTAPQTQCCDRATVFIDLTDDVNPQLSPTPSNTSVSCENIPNAPNVRATDNCSSNLQVEFRETDNTNEGCGTIERRWRTEDECGNVAQHIQIITVNDNTRPTLSGVPGNVTLNCQDNIPNPPSVTARDNCDSNVPVQFEETDTQGNNPDDCNFYNYRITRTWIASDECGNIRSEQQVITVQDVTRPNFVGLPQSNIDVSCENVPNSANVTANDNCESRVTVDFNETSTQSNDPNNCNFYNYVITRTWNIEDPCGNSRSFTQTINVSDTEDPDVCCQDVSIQLDANGQASISPSDVNCGATDNCAQQGNLDFSLSQTNFTFSDVGRTTVTLTVTDPCSNSVQCTARITTDEFDLALRKELAAGEDERVYTGEQVTFTITVFNQGSIPASNIQVIDYIPAGLQLDDNDWTNNGGGSASITLPGTLQPGSSTTVDVTFLVTSNNQEELINRSEIQSATVPAGFTTTDSDSTPDGALGNDDGGVVDSATDDEVNQRPPVDEDDEDPENIFNEIFDLALRKTINSNTQQPIIVGRTVIFDIEVFNQGTVSAQNIEVTDYLPTQGLTLNDPNWTSNGNSATFNQLLSLNPGRSQTVQIRFTVDQDFDGISLNVAEISDAQDEFGDRPQDIDSTPDDSNANDTSVDNEINNGGGDEDDHDPEEVQVERFDLALIKLFNPAASDLPLVQNRDVAFEIQIGNQGTVDATQIEITDYIPTGLTLNDPNWTDNGNGTATYNQLLNISAGQAQAIMIIFTIDANVTGTLVNEAEISDARDDSGARAIDIDSTPDDNVNNDNGGEVNTPDDNNLDGNGRQGEDEDDADPEDINVETFDLALRKRLANQTQMPIAAGRTVTFDIEVINQGTITATGIEITDYIPNGLTLADADWTQSGNTAVYNDVFSLPAGQTAFITIDFTVDAFFEGTLINVAEISDARDEMGDPVDDIDSNPDSNPGNDTTVDDEINNGGGDEDDADPAEILVERFDLALQKVFAPGQSEGPILQNRLVTFDINIVNQGTLDATEIEISDYIPNGLTLEDSDWTANSGTATYNQLLSLNVGQSTTIQITFRVDSGVEGTLVNRAEISDAKDEFGEAIEDFDSTPDAAIGNDDGGEVNTADDDNLAGNGRQGEDEDDEDPEDIFVETFDLALRKTINSSTQQPYVAGRVVTFDIEVFNQGTVDATGIEITDYIPAGLTLADANWSGNGTTAVFNQTLSINSGQSQTITISFTVDDFIEGTLINFAEISDARDEDGDPADDIDSTPDALDNNDTSVDDEIVVVTKMITIQQKS